MYKSLMTAVVLASITLAGCGKSEEAAEAEPAGSMFAEYEGEWMTEAYVGDSEEPVVVLMMNATGEKEGWSWKFTHIDEPVPATNVFMKDDSLVVQVGMYASALREGENVQSVTSYMHKHGAEMTGRFHAVYESGDELHGSLIASRID